MFKTTPVKVGCFATTFNYASGETEKRATIVEPNADGVFSDWLKDEALDERVEVLDTECVSMGLFQPLGDGRYTLPSIGGLVIWKEPFFSHPDKNNTPEISDTNECLR